jgi:hypothetical protein
MVAVACMLCALAGCGGGDYSTNTSSGISTIPSPQGIGSILFSPSTLGAIGSTTEVSATATSGLPVNFSTSTPSICLVTGGSITRITNGTCIILAQQAGNSTYAAAPQVARPVPSGMGTTTTVVIDIPPRVQWENNYGYCGEVALISAGLYYGQSLSQYTVRALASGGMTQGNIASQLLIGTTQNAATAAQKLGLNYLEKETTDNSLFYAWVKNQVALGHPVFIGISIPPTKPGNEYDHIVPVVGVGSMHANPKTDGCYDDDVFMISDNGVNVSGGPTANAENTYTIDNAYMPFYYNFPVGTGNCSNTTPANPQSIAIYSLVMDPTIIKYGIAITGIADTTTETLPVRVSSNLAYESMADITDATANIGVNPTPPAPISTTLTIMVSNLVAGQAYNLYKYTDSSKVPTGNFNAAAVAAGISPWKVFVPTSTTWSTTFTMTSNSQAIFRAVKVSAK